MIWLIVLKKGNFDLGVAYDGDADRVVVVDENGGIIRSDILMSIFVKKIISKEDSVILMLNVLGH